jgi:signal transduction histidine kinase
MRRVIAWPRGHWGGVVAKIGQMMGSLTYLLALYAWVRAINAAVAGCLWMSTRSDYYRILFLGWTAGFVIHLINALVETSTPLIRALTFATSFPFEWLFALLLAMLAGLGFPRRLFLSVMLLSLPMAALLIALSAPPWAALLPVTLAAALPPVWVSCRALFGRNGRYASMSIPLKGYAFFLLLEGLHSLDYGFVFSNPSLLEAGFSLGFAFSIAFTLFGPAAIAEKIGLEKTALESDMRYQALLAQANRRAALEKMAGGMAHEVNNPLGVALLNNEFSRRLLKAGHTDSPQLERALQTVSLQLNRVARIVSGLIAFAGESNSPDAAADSSFNELLKNTLALCNEKCRSRGVELEVPELKHDIPLRVPLASGTRVLLELINNSLEATDLREQGWVRVEAREENGFCLISVVDSGSGVPESVREKIFDPFFTTKPVGKGVGLGLSVSKGIAEAFGGQLSLVSDERGTRFDLSIPVAYVSRATESAASVA